MAQISKRIDGLCDNWHYGVSDHICDARCGTELECICKMDWLFFYFWSAFLVFHRRVPRKVEGKDILALGVFIANGSLYDMVADSVSSRTLEVYLVCPDVTRDGSLRSI